MTDGRLAGPVDSSQSISKDLKRPLVQSWWTQYTGYEVD